MTLYDKHMATFVKDVIPKEELKELINVFMQDAGINMGNDFTDTTLERTIEIIERNFRFLPVCYVMAAFKKGSLGQFGAGRLVPRVIYGWLNEITIEYNRDRDHKRNELDSSIAHFKDLEIYPLGKAICWKIDYVSEADWDRVTLKSVAQMIGQGHLPTLKDFGIKK